MHQVINWDDFFEGSKSRNYKNKTSCQLPTKHGLGYRRLVRRKDGPALFGAWCALIQVLSRHQSPRLGYITENGSPNDRPLSPADLEILTDIPSKIFADMLQVCASQDVGWIKVLQSPDKVLQSPDEGQQYPLNSDLDLDSDSDSDSDSDLDSKEKKTKSECVRQAESIYNVYPKKVGKGDAMKSIAKALKTISYDDLLSAVQAFSKSQEGRIETNYIPNPSTWFNQQRWTDDRSTWEQWKRGAGQPIQPPIDDRESRNYGDFGDGD